MAGYDAVIVGAGSAGCVLAARLSEDPACRVLLLEAGGAARPPMWDVPGASHWMQDGPMDWGFRTEPQDALHGRRIALARGRGLGGSSAINYCLYVRGNPGDYDLWAQRGCSGWGWADVLPYFKRAEANAVHDDALHGTDGPLHVEDYAASNPLEELYFEACEQAGVPRNPDFNGAAQAGCGRYQATVRDGRRWGAAQAYLEPALARPNLTVETGCLVAGLTFEGARCTGVEYLQGREVKRAEAREVVLAAGALGSPHVLLLSGVGPAEELAAHGIETVADLPGVGRNLLDHIGQSPVDLLVKDPEKWGFADPGLEAQKARFERDRTGSFGSMYNHAGAFVHMRPGEADPSAQMYFSVTLAERYRGTGAPAAARLSGCVCRSRSEGRVTLASASPFDKPLIDPRYFSDPDDLERTVEIVEWNREIAMSDA
ncbi:MAG: GMC family oxidoreductase N-terminal domain-containing protein, partial [Pseudomonadota bacterium]